MYSIRFYLHTRVLRSGARPVYFDARWAKTRAADPTSASRLRGGCGVTVQPADWNDEAERLRGRGDDYAKKNRDLTALRARLEEIINQHDATATVLTPAALLSAARPSKAEKRAVLEANPEPDSFEELYARWARHYRTRYAAKYLTRPRSLLHHLRAFALEHTRKRVPLLPAQFVPDPRTRRCDLFEDFCTYLVESAVVRGRTTPGLDNNTASKVVDMLRTLLKFAGQPIDWMSDELEYEVTREPLTFEEVERLRLVELDDPRLIQARDLFVFACFTGPRFENLRNLATAVVTEQDGAHVLEYSQYKGKKKSEVRVAMDPVAVAIWNRYGGQLPHPANSKFNERIKQVAALAGLDRPIRIVRMRGQQRTDTIRPLHEVLSAHIARHTFATLLIDGNASLFDVQHGLGHASVQMAQKYAKRRAKARHGATLGAFAALRAGAAADVPSVPETDKKPT